MVEHIMDVEASIEQVAGILVREGLNFQTAKDGNSYRLLFGSAAVFINFREWDGDSVVITVHSPVLQDIDPGSPGAALALNRLNELNRRHFFVKFVFTKDTLIVDYDLLGDRLQAPELLNAVYTVAAVADDLDDKLVVELGGKRYEDVMQEWESEEEEEEA